MLHIDVDTTQFPDFSFELTEELAPGTFLRIKASGVSMMSGARVASIRAGGEGLSIVHRYQREEMEKNWGWYIRTQSMAVARVERSIQIGSSVVVSVEPAMRQSTYTTDSPKAVQMKMFTHFLKRQST